jgi:oligopeptidase A
MNANMSNPLLDFSGLPRFSDIKTEHVEPAIDTLLAAAKKQLETTASTAPEQATWEDTLLPLDVVCEQLSRAWGVVGHLHSVADTDELRAAYNACLPKTTEFWTMVGQDERLYAIYKAIEQSDAAKLFTPARLKVLANSIRGFKLGGAELPADQKPRYAEIQDRQAAITAKFSENVLDATNAFELIVTDKAELAGIPDYAVQAAEELAKSEGKEGYKFTLQFPSYFPVLQYADKRELRETLYEAYAKRASEFGPTELDNTALIRELLQLRLEEAQMLGYKNFGELSLVPKMANTPGEVVNFLRELALKAKPFALRDLEEIKAFAKAELGMDELQGWDMSYASEKLKEKKYAFSDLEVRQYFQEDRVLDGLFKLTEKLFSVQIVKAQADTWHPDVRFFEVQKEGKAIAHFYLDPYARASKRSGAWMDDARGRKRTDQGVQTPVAYLTCNYTKPAAGKPAQLSHDDVQTLFHEFGHGIHHMLTRVDELDVAGINGVEWDAVELPSQFMENFAWEWSVVESLTAHETTGEPMPKALFDKMVHTDFDPHSGTNILDLLAQVRSEVAVLIPPAYNRFPNSFGHIFAGGYAAGYYSYKWAEVLSADAFAMFEENGVVSPETGKKFLEEILSVGGSRPAAESFKAFRGREPSIDALLRHTGMVDNRQAA